MFGSVFMGAEGPTFDFFVMLAVSAVATFLMGRMFGPKPAPPPAPPKSDRPVLDTVLALLRAAADSRLPRLPRFQAAPPPAVEDRDAELLRIAAAVLMKEPEPEKRG